MSETKQTRIINISRDHRWGVKAKGGYRNVKKSEDAKWEIMSVEEAVKEVGGLIEATYAINSALSDGDKTKL